MAARTTLMAKAACQENQWRRIPLASSPKMALPPATAAQTPTAFVRSAGGYVPVIVDKRGRHHERGAEPDQTAQEDESLAEDTAIAAADAARRRSGRR
jgi:hypothetical protein